jgi:2'-5' RNA ligase
VSARRRLFVALDLPEVVRGALADWCARVAPAGVRRVPAENLHLTLAFLGSRSDDESAAVAGLLEPLVRASVIEPLSTADVLWLPLHRPAVLAVGLEGGQGLVQLQEALVAGLTRAVGFVPERRAFRPHVTVGRFPRDAQVRATPFAEPDEPPELIFRALSLGLYSSHTGRGGARYEALASIRLPS